MKKNNPHLREEWLRGQDEGDDVVGEFNKFCHTLMRLGIVEIMFMEVSKSRYHPPAEEYEWEEDEYYDVGVTVRVDGVLRMHGVYSGWL